MKQRELSPNQSAVLNFVLERHERDGWWPTYREIIDNFGWVSTNYIFEVMAALEKKGYVERRKGRDYRVLP